MTPLELEIITPGNTIFKGMVSSLIIPAYEGYMGIMAGHASFIGALGTGKFFFNIATKTSSLKQGTETSEESRPTTKQDTLLPDKTFDNSVSTYIVRDGFIEIISRPFSMTKVTILAENISYYS